jgi:hypothetical protein
MASDNLFDLHRKEPARLKALAASIRDGRGQVLHRQMVVVETPASGEMRVRQPTMFLLPPAPAGTAVPDGRGLPDRLVVERHLLEQALDSSGRGRSFGQKGGRDAQAPPSGCLLPQRVGRAEEHPGRLGGRMRAEQGALHSP